MLTNEEQERIRTAASNLAGQLGEFLGVSSGVAPPPAVIRLIEGHMTDLVIPLLDLIEQDHEAILANNPCLLAERNRDNSLSARIERLEINLHELTGTVKELVDFVGELIADA